MKYFLKGNYKDDDDDDDDDDNNNNNNMNMINGFNKKKEKNLTKLFQEHNFSTPIIILQI